MGNFERKNSCAGGPGSGEGEYSSADSYASDDTFTHSKSNSSIEQGEQGTDSVYEYLFDIGVIVTFTSMLGAGISSIG